jgi:hypothetical protein
VVRACIVRWQDKKTQTILLESLNDRDHWKDVGVYWRIIVKWILDNSA